MTGRPRVGKSAEFFFQLPLRLTDALKQGEISGTGVLIVTFLAAECFRNEDVALLEVAQLQRAVDFGRSRDSFLRELHKLRPDWIDFELGERQRKAVAFTLTGGAVRAVASTVAPEEVALRQTSDAERQLPRTAVAEPHSFVGHLQLRQRASCRVTRTEQTRPDQTRPDTCPDCRERPAEVEYGELHLCRGCVTNRERISAELRQRGGWSA